MKSLIGALVGSVLAVVGGAEAYLAVAPRLQMAASMGEIHPIPALLILGGIPAVALVIAAIALYAGGRPSRLAGFVGLLSTILCVLSYYLTSPQIGFERFSYHATVVVGLVVAYGWAIAVGSGRATGAAKRTALSEDSAA
ncbi:hypothetical protein [Zhihengliuella halotolerans]|uniref:Uncharacterized protein n=1 Tax=Zhihengliuella halotolerans TaxID=370736 RepID=A0A4Q8ACJ8_9MICC|nr:hypothetical protein [Zhihengliuella halotolerans]RZU61922.1 hypothetical protein EV380_1504 [Zhihengliuella halotolerans]